MQTETSFQQHGRRNFCKDWVANQQATVGAIYNTYPQVKGVEKYNLSTPGRRDTLPSDTRSSNAAF